MSADILFVRNFFDSNVKSRSNHYNCIKQVKFKLKGIPSIKGKSWIGARNMNHSFNIQTRLFTCALKCF